MLGVSPIVAERMALLTPPTPPAAPPGSGSQPGGVSRPSPHRPLTSEPMTPNDNTTASQPRPPRPKVFNKKPFVNVMKIVGEPRWLKAPPTTPADSPEFEAQMDEVLAVSTEAQYQFPAEFMARHGLPAHAMPPLADHCLDDDGQLSGPKCAQTVRMDHPFMLLLVLLQWLTGQGINYRTPERFGWATNGSIDFIGATIWPVMYVGWHIVRAIQVIFRMKWRDWVVRAEEWWGFNMTHYTEGAPGHGGDPAGHGGIAGATAASLIQLFTQPLMRAKYSSSVSNDGSTYRLPLDVAMQTIVLTCLTFASFRTFAGVHRHIENVRGFIIGWATVRRISFADAAAEIEIYAPGSTRIATAA